MDRIKRANLKMKPEGSFVGWLVAASHLLFRESLENNINLGVIA